MIKIERNLPFEECDGCGCFDPSFHNGKLFGDDKVIMTEIVISCHNIRICREIREQLKNKEAKQDAAE